MSVKNIFSSKSIILYFTLIVTGLFFFFYGIIAAKEFLAPLVLAMVLALLTFPLANKLESKGLKPIFSTLINVLLLLLMSLLFAFVISWQMKNFVDDWEQIQESIASKIESVEELLLEHTQMDEGDLEKTKSSMGIGEEDESERTNEGNGFNSDQAVNVLGGVANFLTDFLITFIYIFFFIHFRQKFKQFILKLFALSKREEVKSILAKSTSVVRHYIIGRLVLMVFLAALYGLGLWISGVENFILVSLIAALLSIIPFAGNFFGYLLAIMMGIFSGGDMSVLLGVTITFLVIQFVETYILQPIVLGGKLNVHPFFIILSVILGNYVWGIIGMVLAIPIFAIIAVVSRHLPALEAFGYLFSSDDETK